jgi:hypothetical protein
MGPPEYEAGLLISVPQRSVMLSSGSLILRQEFLHGFLKNAASTASDRRPAAEDELRRI